MHPWTRLTLTASLVLAAATGRGETPPATIKTDIGTELVLIKGGSFVRGSDSGPANERPAREIGVDAFYMSRCPITQREYARIMRSNPCRWDTPNGANPVESVRWVDAITFCNKLSEIEGLQPVYDLEAFKADFGADGYRLPTEAEWEYAARAGTTTRFFWGDGADKLKHYAWYKENAGGRTRAVGAKHPSPWGLHDVYGNVWEWCHDDYQPDYYAQSPAKNPTGPETGEQRVLRGGSWDTSLEKIGATHRHSEDPGYYDICFGYDIYGFRIVRSAAASRARP